MTGPMGHSLVKVNRGGVFAALGDLYGDRGRASGMRHLKQATAWRDTGCRPAAE